MLFAGHALLSAQELAAKKIILVAMGDEREGWKIIQAINQQSPYLALQASNGFAVLKVCQLLQPSLFLLEKHLPDSDALHLYQRLTASPAFQAIPFLLVSEEGLAAPLERLGIGWIKKPVNQDDLLVTIELCLR